MTVKTNWLAFNINFPLELKDTYDYLQSEMNYFLTHKTYRKKLELIDLTQHKGNVWRQMRDLFKPRISKWEISNKTWYSYIFFENLRRELMSKRQRTQVWDLYLQHDKVINPEFMKILHDNKLYPTRGEINNLVRANARPELPEYIIFNLDYSISAAQMFTMDMNNLCNIQLMNGEWLPYQILLPTSLHQNLTGKVAKPRFMKRRSDGKYIGLCSYEYIPNKNSYDKILGIDLGKIKLFSAIAMSNTGNYSKEYIHSKRTQKVYNKLNRLYTEKDLLINKINRSEAYNINKTNKQLLRDNQLSSITNKAIRIKKCLAKKLANEIIQVALQEKCSEVHVENLSWLESQGGKWNFSEIQKFLQQKCKQYNIKFVKVSAFNSSKMNPSTGEIGIIHNRTVEFSNYLIDRDLLAAINLSLRTKVSRSRTINHLRKKHPYAKRVITNSRRKHIKQLVAKYKPKRNSQIVVFQPCQVSDSVSYTTWRLINQAIVNSSLLPRANKYQL